MDLKSLYAKLRGMPQFALVRDEDLMGVLTEADKISKASEAQGQQVASQYISERYRRPA